VGPRTEGRQQWVLTYTVALNPDRQFDQLNDKDLRELAGLFRRAGAEETHPRFRDAMLAIPESFGLEGEDDF